MDIKDKQPKILIVDDEKINIDILVGLLRPYYQIVAAKDGEQAFKRIEKEPLPDLILLDIMMPGMDGYEVCRKIKDSITTRHIPVIFITCKSEEQDEAKGFESGAVDYITKPFSPLITLARVKTHIQLKYRGDMLERLAILDGLTGIPNRRRFNQFLDYEWERSMRYQHPFSLILMDIDHFKLYNDHYGHQEGDVCLKRVAKAISEAMPRTVDLAARYGGEEFACILPETGKNGGWAAANRILEAVRALKIPHAQSKISDHVTISIGITSVIPTAKERSLDLIKMADKALYNSKQNGRNQVSFFDEKE
ncbi:MAG: diguanylate cyclase [Magnetococcus sp. DMHC-6]